MTTDQMVDYLWRHSQVFERANRHKVRAALLEIAQRLAALARENKRLRRKGK